MSNKVTYDEQLEQGLVRPRQTFVPALRGEVLPPLKPTQADTSAVISFDVAPTATQHIEMRTSAVDRARGFVIETSLLAGVLGVGLVFLAWLFADMPFLSGYTVTLFVVTFAVTWVYAYSQHKKHTAEGVSLYEARRKFDVIELDVRKRWEMAEREQRQMLSERTEDRTEARGKRLGGR